MSNANELTVTETNPNGFHHKICVKCTIDPVGTATAISFNNNIEIIGHGPDCSKSLSDAKFVPKQIDYVKSGSKIT